MNGVEIHDSHPRGYLAFDLKEILDCLSQEVLDRTWKCCRIESTSKVVDDELELFEKRGECITGQKLIELAEKINQVIEGDFSGHLPNEETDSLVIKAIDSTLWEVFGNPECLEKIKYTFGDVRPAAYDLS